LERRSNPTRRTFTYVKLLTTKHDPELPLLYVDCLIHSCSWFLSILYVQDYSPLTLPLLSLTTPTPRSSWRIADNIERRRHLRLVVPLSHSLTRRIVTTSARASPRAHCASRSCRKPRHRYALQDTRDPQTKSCLHDLCLSLATFTFPTEPLTFPPKYVPSRSWEEKEKEEEEKDNATRSSRK
jgi:hypothetical protein